MPTHTPPAVHPFAPDWHIAHWLNTPSPITLESLRGKVVLMHAFQMLCPACVSHGLPQATAVRQAFAESSVAVIGIHTVFEHHRVMTHEALQVFAHEQRLRFPIGADMPGADGPIPQTMAAYALRGTPSMVLIDKQGRLRLSHFGHLNDLALGAAMGQLLTEPA
ncbi:MULTISPECIES: peroxiredoxin [unclassified Polaromonas]|uniref:peroxiredoxin family protein n=1 Tax=unclassified Polaromonas TaxID=2638319 RepID=UPI000F077FFB|nr:MULTISPECIES: TlpA disulfide reductase family protein [unclassified Polaromonas]AYQ27831.1 TlpA family protein disulfide reductase [Polaromonas sp. SP1]QGJ17310.1 redoxin domain-containing protein [Polaromonas sp. Pch-P]